MGAQGPGELFAIGRYGCSKSALALGLSGLVHRREILWGLLNRRSCLQVMSSELQRIGSECSEVKRSTRFSYSSTPSVQLFVATLGGCSGARSLGLTPTEAVIAVLQLFQVWQWHFSLGSAIVCLLLFIFVYCLFFFLLFFSFPKLITHIGLTVLLVACWCYCKAAVYYIWKKWFWRYPWWLEIS